MKTEAPSHFTNREIHRRAKEAREAALQDVAAGMGLDLDFVRERASVGRDRLDKSNDDLAAAITNAVRGE